jgi:hypothetical protein
MNQLAKHLHLPINIHRTRRPILKLCHPAALPLFSAFTARLQPPLNKLDTDQRAQRSMYDWSAVRAGRVTLPLSRPGGVVVYSMGVECEGRETEEER